jgi:hypothetical protein
MNRRAEKAPVDYYLTIICINDKYAPATMVRDLILEALEQEHDGMCLDNPEERDAVALGIVRALQSTGIIE